MTAPRNSGDEVCGLLTAHPPAIVAQLLWAGAPARHRTILAFDAADVHLRDVVVRGPAVVPVHHQGVQVGPHIVPTRGSAGELMEGWLGAAKKSTILVRV